MSSNLQLLQTFPIKIQKRRSNYNYHIYYSNVPNNHFQMNSSQNPKIMSEFLSCCLQLLSILKIHDTIGRGQPPATISNLISSTYCKNRKKSDPETDQNYPTWFPNRIHTTKKTQKSLKKCPLQLSPILTSRCPMKILKVS